MSELTCMKCGTHDIPEPPEGSTDETMMVCTCGENLCTVGQFKAALLAESTNVVAAGLKASFTEAFKDDDDITFEPS